MPSKEVKKSVKKPVKKVAVKAVKEQSKKSAVILDLPKETSLKQSVYDISGKVVDSISLPKEIFGAEVNEKLVAQYIRVYLANQRRGTLKTKSRGEVNISTKKIYRQKGTGRARHGAASAPIFVGGGVAFGPRPRDFSLSMTKKMKKSALISSLSAKVKAGEIKIIAGLSKIEPKTKKMKDVLNGLGLINKKTKLLLITPNSSKDFEGITRSARNIKGISLVSSNLLNTYEVLNTKQILFMTESIDALRENLMKGK